MGRAPGGGGEGSLLFIHRLYNKYIISIYNKYIIKYNKLKLWCDFFFIANKIYILYDIYIILLSTYTPLTTPLRGRGRTMVGSMGF